MKEKLKEFTINKKKLPKYIKDITNDIEKKAEENDTIDLPSFEENNWNTYDNEILIKLKEQGGFLFMLSSGKFYFKAKKGLDAKVIKTKSDLEGLLASTLGLPVIQLFKDTKSRNADIYAFQLDIVTIKFSMDAESEFYINDNNIFWTKFKPSKFMQINKIDSSFKAPIHILYLLSNLCAHKEFEFRYIFNWLAGFFQSLEKPKTALVFMGDQGTGKNLFVEFVLTPIFGEEFVSLIDNERLNSRFNAPILFEKVFYIFNELAIPATGVKSVVRNKLKSIITDNTMQVENKGIDPFQAKIIAPSIILSNENIPLQIEDGDRRFFVARTGKNLKKQGIDTNIIVENIEKEIYDFATMLQFYDVDWELYDVDAPMTELKQNIINNCVEPEKLFVTAIKDMNLSFFSEIEDTDKKLYKELKNNFANGEILYNSIAKSYYAVYEEAKFLSSKKILSNLRSIDPILFTPVKQNSNIRSSNGKKYLKIVSD